jgi:hypothetical protein
MEKRETLPERPCKTSFKMRLKGRELLKESNRKRRNCKEERLGRTR